MVIISQAPAAVALTAATGGVFQSAAGGNLLLQAPGSLRLNGRAFTVRASGYTQFNAGTYTAGVTVSTILYANAAFGATVSSSSAIFTVTSSVSFTATASAVACPWLLEAELEGDSVSGLLQGTGQGVVNNVSQARAVIGQAPTGVNFASEPPISFAVANTCASAAAGIVLTSFVLEA